MLETFKEWFYGGLYLLQRYYKWYLLVVLISAAVEWMQRMFLATENVLYLFLFSLFGSVFVSGMHFGLYKLSSTDKLDLSYWRHFFHIFPELLIAFALFTFAAGLGILMFIVPGLIIMTRFMFFPYLMLEYDISIKDAFLHSQFITQGLRSSILGVLVMMMIASAAEIPLIQALYVVEEPSRSLTMFGGILYTLAVLLLHPLAFATLIFAYSQMTRRLAVAVEPGVEQQ
jgi:hypothetical protein